MKVRASFVANSSSSSFMVLSLMTTQDIKTMVQSAMDRIKEDIKNLNNTISTLDHTISNIDSNTSPERLYLIGKDDQSADSSSKITLEVITSTCKRFTLIKDKDSLKKHIKDFYRECDEREYQDAIEGFDEETEVVHTAAHLQAECEQYDNKVIEAVYNELLVEMAKSGRTFPLYLHSHYYVEDEGWAYQYQFEDEVPEYDSLVQYLKSANIPYVKQVLELCL